MSGIAIKAALLAFLVSAFTGPYREIVACATFSLICGLESLVLSAGDKDRRGRVRWRAMAFFPPLMLTRRDRRTLRIISMTLSALLGLSAFLAAWHLWSRE